jgi:glucan 1,3-beta-glucosidase
MYLSERRPVLFTIWHSFWKLRYQNGSTFRKFSGQILNEEHGFMSGKTNIGVVLIAVLAFVSLAAGPAIAAPEISFLSVPSPGSMQGWVSGIAEDITPTEYVVVLYIQVDGRWWGPKPYWDAPLTTIRSDRFWNTTFVTYPTDSEADRFAAFLIPRAALGPGMPPALTGASNLPDSLSAFPSDEQGRAVPVLVPVSFKRNGTEMVGLCFGPYLNGEDPGITTIPEPVLRERLVIVRNYTTWVRSYGVDGGLEPFGETAHSLGMKSAVGAWLGNDTEANLHALETLIEIGNQGEADVLIVGSEALIRNDLSDRDLVTYIQWVRSEVPGVPVGTADSYDKFIEYPSVVEASDLLLVHIYPFWDGVGIDTAVNYTIEKYETVVEKAGGRPVVIAELGWPDNGSPYGYAVPSQANAVRYLHETTARLHEQDIPYFYFSTFDEAWKSEGDVGVGPYWGLWYGNLTLKPCRMPLIKPLPGYTKPPTDPDHDGLYEDMNGGGTIGFGDVVVFFNYIEWIKANEPVCAFDFSGNSGIGFQDVVVFFNQVG